MDYRVPDFWKNDLIAIDKALNKLKKGKSSILTHSAGGRPIYLVEYGKKQNLNRRANYSSACSYRDPSVYANKTGDIKPVILLVGATHGGEVEGISAILNLMEVLETGTDLRGKKWGFLHEASEDYRILMIPCLNPDGRARVPFQVVSEVSPEEVVLYKHGRWKDGSLADYSQGFRVHPILHDVDYMGGYYNDDGVNLSVDNFFAPMGLENISLMRLVDQEAPDFTVLLHTGCHLHAKIMSSFYLPGYIRKKILRFDHALAKRFKENGYGYYTLEEQSDYLTDSMEYPPKPFKMSTAIHHTCGGLCVTYESYEAVDDEKDIYSCNHMLDCHFLLFEEVLKFSSREHIYEGSLKNRNE